MQPAGPALLQINRLRLIHIHAVANVIRVGFLPVLYISVLILRSLAFFYYFMGQGLLPPRHKATKMLICMRVPFVSWCLCGNLFPAFGGSGIGGN